MESKKLPQYVTLGEGGTEMRLKDGGYWRDAGQWGVGYKWVDGKLFSVFSQGDSLDNQPLIEITKQQWREGNKGYV